MTRPQLLVFAGSLLCLLAGWVAVRGFGWQESVSD